MGCLTTSACSQRNLPLLPFIIFHIINLICWFARLLKVSRCQHASLHWFADESIGRSEIVKGRKFGGSWVKATPWLSTRLLLLYLLMIVNLFVLGWGLVLTLLAAKLHYVHQRFALVTIRNWLCSILSFTSLSTFRVALRITQVRLTGRHSFLTHENLPSWLVSFRQETPRFVVSIALGDRGWKHLRLSEIHAHRLVVARRLVTASIALIPLDHLYFPL